MGDYNYSRGLGHGLHCRDTVPVLNFPVLNVLCVKHRIPFGLSHTEGILLYAVEYNPNWNQCSKLFTTCSQPFTLSCLLLFSILAGIHVLFTSFCTEFTAYKHTIFFYISMLLYIFKEMPLPHLGKLLLNIQFKYSVNLFFPLWTHNTLFIPLA